MARWLTVVNPAAYGALRTLRTFPVGPARHSCAVPISADYLLITPNKQPHPVSMSYVSRALPARSYVSRFHPLQELCITPFQGLCITVPSSPGAMYHGPILPRSYVSRSPLPRSYVSRSILPRSYVSRSPSIQELCITNHPPPGAMYHVPSSPGAMYHGPILHRSYV